MIHSVCIPYCIPYFTLSKADVMLGFHVTCMRQVYACVRMPALTMATTMVRGDLEVWPKLGIIDGTLSFVFFEIFCEHFGQLGRIFVVFLLIGPRGFRVQ